MPRWWLDDLTRTYRQDAPQAGSHADNASAKSPASAQPLQTAMLRVSQLGPGATVRSVRESLQNASGRRILDVCMYTSAAPPATVGSVAIVECSEHDVRHLLTFNGMEIDGISVTIKPVDLKRRGMAANYAARMQAQMHAAKERALLGIVNSEENHAKASPSDLTLWARFKEAQRRLHLFRYGGTRRCVHAHCGGGVVRHDSDRALICEQCRRVQPPISISAAAEWASSQPSVVRPVRIPSKEPAPAQEYVPKLEPERPWRCRQKVPAADASLSSTSSRSGFYLGRYFLGLDRGVRQGGARVPRQPWAPPGVAHVLRFGGLPGAAPPRRCTQPSDEAHSELPLEGRGSPDLSAIEKMLPGYALQLRRGAAGYSRRGVRGKEFVCKWGRREYSRRLRNYLALLEAAGVLTDSNYALALATFHVEE